jgi:hypothetical protein
MRSLFAQDARECTVRPVGMKAPVSLRTFEVEPGRPRSLDIKQFLATSQARWRFVLPATEARARLEARKWVLNNEIKNATGDSEPMSARTIKKRKRK